MRILVTGGAGFIGCNFVRHALARTEVQVALRALVDRFPRYSQRVVETATGRLTSIARADSGGARPEPPRLRIGQVAHRSRRALR